MTAMYTSSQVLLAQSVGAEYAAPYLGRMNDAYGNNQGYKEVVQMQRILTTQKARTRLLVASIRDAFTMASLAAEVRGQVDLYAGTRQTPPRRACLKLSRRLYPHSVPRYPKLLIV
ncbi:hypothetical protein Vafri_21926 [Volvox africanus]|nr:hypothetical protein Vafri_21926 [Volvox africanus]